MTKLGQQVAGGVKLCVFPLDHSCIFIIKTQSPDMHYLIHYLVSKLLLLLMLMPCYLISHQLLVHLGMMMHFEQNQ